MVSDSLEEAYPQKDREYIDFENLHPQKDRKCINIFRGVTILAVDDDENILVLITYIFESYGIQVMTASNASSAFEVINKCKVDLLISDIDLPGESGYLLIQKVRSLPSPQRSSIPAIAFSGNPQHKRHGQALASGFQTFMKKTSNHTQLITEVAKLLLRDLRGRKSSSSLFGDYC